jgi:hypothetical protein
VAILVDEPIWDWRGRKWAHLVTDSHLDELHDFAQRLGMPYLSFQGDHYDIHTELRARALVAGARAVTGREVVVALREAGLRRRGPVESWRWEWERSGDVDDLIDLVGPHGHEVGRDLHRLASLGPPVTAARAVRSTESVLVLSSPEMLQVDTGFTIVGDGETIHRSVGERGTYLEWRRTGA